MVNKRIPFLIVIVIFLSGCEKLKDLTQFEIKNESNISIPGQNTGIGELLSIPRAEVQSSSEQSFRNNNTRADLVEEAILEELQLTITNPADANFDFLNEISIYISAEGEQEVLVASKSNIAEDGSQSLQLETTGVDLKPFIVKDHFSIRTAATTDQVIDEDVDIRVNMTFGVTAKVF
ncbi:hypothetical protein [Nafulsella turpanensis]|uniref:hypothetical protein n=1 Tax=Nafulsella turpanensis TaxID=1265690 RepID=UPI00034931CF|nr:hypothetical protein [Nafulsella turpanensis]